MSKSIILEKKNKVKSVKASKYFNSKIIEKRGSVKINQTLPFRIKITNIGIPGYGPGIGAPIGIAVIGFNNYIL